MDKLEFIVNSKGEKFRPRKIPRYLPGSVQFSVLDGDLKEYNNHLYRVFAATPRVDATPPKFHFDKYLGLSNIQSELQALKDLDRTNKKMLEKINTINRTRGIIDTFNQYANNHSSKWGLKVKQFERINKDNKKLHRKLLKTASTYPKAEHDVHWKRMVHKMKYFSKYPLVILNTTTRDQILRQCCSISKNIEINQQEVASRPKCFLEFKIDNGIIIGKVIVELYNDQVPNTVEHFLNLCRAKKKKSLRNCPVSKIIVNKYCIAGDLTNYSGDGKTLESENFNLQHTRPGVLSMITTGENNEVSSQFCITLSEMPEFDSKNVVFGKIIEGGLILFKVGQFGTWHGKPITKIIISDCGVCETKQIRNKPTLKKKGR